MNFWAGFVCPASAVGKLFFFASIFLVPVSFPALILESPVVHFFNIYYSIQMTNHLAGGPPAKLSRVTVSFISKIEKRNV